MGLPLRRKVLLMCSGGSTASIEEFQKLLKRPAAGSLPQGFELVRQALGLPQDVLEELVDRTVWHQIGDAQASRLDSYQAPVRQREYHDAWLVVGTPNTLVADLNQGYIAEGDFTRIMVKSHAA